eukprot:CAMPEP_0174830344 /NCGR_PEP_ID=MMETSP1114-20130205/2470_1 /TAXON_ID=312471 /ORGANISM="Neobodo designis, Strain CCAP 1951/1" /LENGTH=145 /DNA_ID=CAMNT_0016064139 /DNA_START=47 /DNA_END=481 /DNA_ORIENTATION=-
MRRLIHVIGLIAVVLAASLTDAERLAVCTTPNSASAYQLSLEFGSVGDCLQFAANYTIVTSPGMWVNGYEQCNPMAVYCMDFPNLGDVGGFTLPSISQQAPNVAWGGIGTAATPTLGLASCDNNLYCGNGCTGRGTGLVVGTCGS